MQVAGDWLQGDPRDADLGAQARDEQRRKDVESAQLYYAVFVSNPSGRKLLELWDEDMRNMSVSVNATLSQFVAAETSRGFVRKIHEKIKLVSTEGKS